jgi:ribosomal protein S27AE
MREGADVQPLETGRATAATPDQSLVPLIRMCPCGQALRLATQWTVWTCGSCGRRLIWNVAKEAAF